MYHALIHASELLTGAGFRVKDGRHPIEADLGPIPDGALVYSLRKTGKKTYPDQVIWAGPTSEIPKVISRKIRKHIDLKGSQSVIPGLIDCHTHLVFAGDRAGEFAARCAGASYDEIAAKGGGILTTVQATRGASEQELLRLAIPRVKEVISYGVRTLEIKSGYGLSFESELKVLRVIQKLRRQFPEITICATFLGAHAFPPDRKRSDYLQDLLKMINEVSRKNLATACDVFIDRGYFTVEEGRTLLRHAQGLGLKVKVHADELALTESASLAAELGALSADHLLQISETGIARLAASQTVAVLLPGTAFYLKAAHAPAKKLLAAGAAVALATDFNPGTCMTVSLPTIMTIAALYLGMSRAELLAAVTYNAAKALDLHSSRGTLEAGLRADFTVLPFRRFEEMYYRFAWSAR